MASKRWDLCVSHKDEKTDKWRSTRVGVVFEGDNGQLNIKIDPGVSVSTPKGVNLTAWEPKERGESTRGGGAGGSGRGENRGGGGGGYGPPNTGTDDDIPFAPLRGEI